MRFKLLFPEQRLGPAGSVLRPKSQLLAQHSHCAARHKLQTMSPCIQLVIKSQLQLVSLLLYLEYLDARGGARLAASS